MGPVTGLGGTPQTGLRTGPEETGNGQNVGEPTRKNQGPGGTPTLCTDIHR